MSKLVGKTLLNRYNVREFLGRGGMAEVYKVWDSQRLIHLAAKVLHTEMALDRVFLRRFKREAETLVQLQHPHIIRSYGLQQEGRVAFLLMDYVEGESLKELIFDTHAPLPEKEIRKILRAITGALHYAHNMGFVHCDIKPSNIMMDKYGEVRLADFGIARMTDAATATMVGAGTPAYMAPEQVRGEDPTPQTDIYALGILLYEMLTGGERPFTGEIAGITGSTSEKIRWEQTRLEPPSIKEWNPDIAPALDTLIQKTLQKAPEDRYENVLTFYNTFERALSDRGNENLLSEIPTNVDENLNDLLVLPEKLSPPKKIYEKVQVFFQHLSWSLDKNIFQGKKEMLSDQRDDKSEPRHSFILELDEIYPYSSLSPAKGSDLSIIKKWGWGVIAILTLLSLILGIALINMDKEMDFSARNLIQAEGIIRQAQAIKRSDDAKIDGYIYQLDSTEKTIAANEAQISSLETELDVTQTKLEGEKKELTTANTKIDNLEDKISGLDNKIDALKDDVSDLEDLLPVKVKITNSSGAQQMLAFDNLIYIWVPNGTTRTFYIKPGSYSLKACNPNYWSGCKSWGSYSIYSSRNFTIN